MTLLLQKELTTEKQFRIMISKHPEKQEGIKEITRAGAVKEILGYRKRQPSFQGLHNRQKTESHGAAV